MSTSFSAGIRKTKGVMEDFRGVEARLDGAGLFLIVSRSRFNPSHFKMVSEREYHKAISRSWL